MDIRTNGTNPFRPIVPPSPGEAEGAGEGIRGLVERVSSLAKNLAQEVEAEHPQGFGGIASLVADVAHAVEAGQRSEFGLAELAALAPRNSVASLLAGNAQAQQDLAKLKADGKLTPEVQAQLDKLASQPLAAGIDRKELLASALRNLADPTSISQGGRNTCAAASAQIMLAQENPADYLKMIGGLASPEGKATLANGDTIQRDPSWNNDPNRSVVDNLMQPAFMQYATGGGYDNTTDTRLDGAGQGLYADEEAKLTNAVIGGNAGTVFGNSDQVMNELAKATAKGLPVTAVVQGTDANGKPYVHSVVVESVKDGKVTYIDPHGERKTISQAEFQKQVNSVNIPKNLITPEQAKETAAHDRGPVAGCGGIIGAICHAVSSVVGGICDAVTKAFNAVVDFATNAFCSVLSAVGGAIAGGLDSIGLHGLAKVCREAVDDVEDAVKKFSELAKTVMAAAANLTKIAVNTMTALVENPGDILNILKKSIKDTFHEIGHVINKALEAVMSLPGMKQVMGFLASKYGQYLMMVISICAMIPPLSVVCGPIALAYSLYQGVKMAGAGMESGNFKQAVMGVLTAVSSYVGLSGIGKAAGIAGTSLSTDLNIASSAIKAEDAVEKGDIKGAIMDAGAAAAGAYGGDEIVGGMNAQQLVNTAEKAYKVEQAVEDKDWTTVAAVGAGLAVGGLMLATTETDENGNKTNWVTQKVDEAKEWVGDKVDDFMDSSVGQALSDAGNYVVDGISSITDTVSGAVDSLQDTVSDLDSKLDPLRDTFDSASDSINDAAGQVVDGIHDVGAQIDASTDGLRDALGDAVDAVGDQVGAGVDAVHDLGAGIDDATDGARDAIGDTVDSVANAGSDLAGQVEDGLSDVTGAIHDAFSDAADGVEDASGAILDGATGLVDSAVQDAKDGLTAGFDDVKNAFTPSDDGTVEAGGGDADPAETGDLEAPPEGGAHEAGWFDSVKDYANETANNLNDKISDIKDSAEFLANDVKGAADSAQDAFDTVSDAVDTAMTAVNLAKAAKKGDVQGVLDNSAGLLDDAGYEDLADSMRSASDTVGEVKNLVDAVKHDDVLEAIGDVADFAGADNVAWAAEKAQEAETVEKTLTSGKASDAQKLASIADFTDSENLGELADMTAQTEYAAKAFQQGDYVNALGAAGSVLGSDNMEDGAVSLAHLEAAKKQADKGNYGAAMQELGKAGNNQDIIDGGKMVAGAQRVAQDAEKGDYVKALGDAGKVVGSENMVDGAASIRNLETAKKQVDQGNYGAAMQSVGRATNNQDIIDGGKSVSAGERAVKDAEKGDYARAMGEAGKALDNEDLTRGGQSLSSFEKAQKAYERGNVAGAIENLGNATGSESLYDLGQSTGDVLKADQSLKKGDVGKAINQFGQAFDNEDLMETGTQVARGQKLDQAIRSGNENRAEGIAASMVDGYNDEATANLREDVANRQETKHDADVLGGLIDHLDDNAATAANLEAIAREGGAEPLKMTVSADAQKDLASIERVDAWLGYVSDQDFVDDAKTAEQNVEKGRDVEKNTKAAQLARGQKLARTGSARGTSSRRRG